MTIIDFMRDKLSNYPHIAEFMGGEKIHIDFTEGEPNNYGLSSTGDTLVSEDILGNQKRKHSFVLYAVGMSYTDYNRVINSNFLLELAYWLERLPEQDGIDFIMNDGTTMAAKFTKATSANAMSMNLMGDTINEGIMYQLQVYAEYEVESEDMF